MNKQLTTPVLFLIFNRPDTTKRVFEAVRKAKPPKLFVVADGPRPDRPGEWEKCQKVREIVTAVDWDCEVKTLFRDTNLGCKVGVSRAIDWFFQHVEEGIILEDDCLPTQSFFRFCQELLERYRYDERVMMISGNNFQFGRQCGSYSYYFTKYTHIWGWASWKRAWKFYDVNMNLWPEIKKKGLLKGLVNNPKEMNYWEQIFDRVHASKIDTWDYQWTFCCWVQNGLSVLPKVNLVSNIGLGIESTHTHKDSPLANMPVLPMEFPLKHPPFLLCDSKADSITFKNTCSSSFIKRVINRLVRIVR